MPLGNCRCGHEDGCVAIPIAAGLEQEWYIQYHHVFPVESSAGQEFRLCLSDQWMNDPFELSQSLGVAEDCSTKGGAIDRTISNRVGKALRTGAMAAPPGSNNRCTAASAS